jgi:hypothetical protein
VRDYAGVRDQRIGIFCADVVVEVETRGCGVTAAKYC